MLELSGIHSRYVTCPAVAILEDGSQDAGRVIRENISLLVMLSSQKMRRFLWGYLCRNRSKRFMA